MAKYKRKYTNPELALYRKQQGIILYLNQKYKGQDSSLKQAEAQKMGLYDINKRLRELQAERKKLAETPLHVEYPKGENIATDNLSSLMSIFSDVYNEETHKDGTYGDREDMKQFKSDKVRKFRNALEHMASQNLEDYLNKINERLDTITNLLTALQSIWYHEDKDYEEAEEISSSIVDLILNI